jgi:hypothetical protein
MTVFKVTADKQHRNMMLERIVQRPIQYKHRQPGHANQINFPPLTMLDKLSTFDHAHNLNRHTQTRVPKITVNIEHIPSNRTIPN